jgi:hypothetical protein
MLFQAQVKVIDQKDEMFGFVGDIAEIREGGRVLVYFDDIMGTLMYYDYQLEYLGGLPSTFV